MASSVSTVITAKGKSCVKWNTKNGIENEPELLSSMLGPTGNLRAPAIRRGKTLMVGFHEPTYAELFA